MLTLIITESNLLIFPKRINFIDIHKILAAKSKFPKG